MTSQLEKTMNLPRLEDALKQVEELTKEAAALPVIEEDDEEKFDHMMNNLAEMEKEAEYESQMESEDGTLEHVSESNELYDTALQVHKDLVDLAFNMDTTRAASVLEPAMQALNVALQASKSKADHKMKRLKMKLESAKFEQMKKQGSPGGFIDASESGVAMTRDQLLKMMDDEEKGD